MEIYVSADPMHIARERQKARKLRQSQWWKRKLNERQCHYCKESYSPDELTMDHIIPVSRGGHSDRSNVVAACKPCNIEKRHLTPAEIVLKRSAK
jgi:5-methylcytosine-specific restriction endonuclease McrA